jgi:hypothetical protein
MYVRWELGGHWRKKIRPEIGHLAALVTEGPEGLPPAGSDEVLTKLTVWNFAKVKTLNESYIILQNC